MHRAPHPERHRTEHIGWLRAAVLGANDGIVSISSLLVGVAAARGSEAELLVTGGAALVAGAMSMAAGEYVSVSSQSDTERADMARERAELSEHPELERQELAGIYVARGLSTELAEQVAVQLTAHDALAAHARDELGVSHTLTARPMQASGASALSFAGGGILPLLAALLAPTPLVLPAVAASSIVFLCALGAISARIGGAPVLKAVLRVALLGALAMALTAAAGMLFETA